MEAITAYTYQEQQLVIKTALRKQAEKKKNDAILEHHFNLRTHSIEGYFIRLSADSKKQYILQLLENLKSPLSLYQIFSVLSLGHAKMDFYSVVDPETNFVHEKLGLDHDRMLDKKTLKEALATDLEWFATLDEHEQMNFTLHLIRIAGGSSKGSLYMPLYNIYRKTLSNFVQTHTSSKKSVICYEDDDDDDYIKPEYDPKHPASIEVEKQRKKWAELLTKYKNEVNPIPVDSKIKLKDEKNAKKKQKKQKKSKKDKKVKEEVVKTKDVDMIQLLPIWIVKKIFCYMSDTELIKLKKVNAYWSFVISELLKERITRLKLDDTLDKMKAAIDPEVFEKAMKEEPLPGKKMKHVFYELVATDKKLIPKDTKDAQEKCLQRSANEDRRGDLDMPNGEFIPFPRYIKKEMELYRYRPCFLQDVGIKFDIEGEIEKQKSFLSYSLAKSLTSLKLSVQEDMLSDW
ncbi:uncharacterized protein [Diabrotica undecimpunctata]|uniref:uncharacterized protein n=1 Tax=Diabrotica undecimpunctata TaxID=50387 RepID=UPI003B631F6C